MTNEYGRIAPSKLDWCVSGALAALAALLYGLTTAGYLYPGESAHLMSVWKGLDTAAFNQYPLLSFFGKLFGGGNAIAPIAGVVATFSLYHVMSFFIRARVAEEVSAEDEAPRSGLVAGVAASVVFMFTPCVWSGFTHLEPRAFDTAWALLAFVLFIPVACGGKVSAWLGTLAVAVMTGFGLADTPLYILLFPLYAFFVWRVFRRRGESPYGPTAAFVFAFFLAFFIYAACAVGDFGAFVKAQKVLAQLYWMPKGWLFVALFATLPFILSLFASRRAFTVQSGWTQWIFHATLSFVAIMTTATPFAPSALMQPYGILPVAAGVFVAWVCGYLAVYWWSQIRGDGVRVNESLDDSGLGKIGRTVGFAVGGVLAVAVFFSIALNFFAFDSGHGEFADEVARKLVSDLDGRTWLVTDGTLDDHIRFAAKFGFQEEKKVNLICLQRDDDEEYLKELGETVKAANLGGERNPELLLSLRLGVLAFVQDWFAADPAAVAKEVAIFGAPDLWYVAGMRAIPEFVFFGGDPARTPDWSLWPEYDKLLSAPKGWGSYRLWETKDPVEKMRYNLRRHLGFIANDRGYWLQDEGKDEEAFKMYELVLNEIDADNVCALFNEFELARSGFKKAVDKKKDLEATFKSIVADADRRYNLWALGNYYGYIRNPEIFIRLAGNWARSGRPGEALKQVRRAIDFIPNDERIGALNMMAALYASGDDQKKSREIYEQVLEKDAVNHDALIGLMRLELLDGNTEKAMEYLRLATDAAGDDPRAVVEVAMLQMMQGDLAAAKKLLRKATDADHGNIQAWSLLAAVVMQQYDATTDAAERKALMKELKDEILVTMDKQATGEDDYHLQTTRAFVLLHEAQDEESRRAARDAFSAAAKERPDVAATGDIVLGLDISLNDTVDAERQAREVLRRNRKAPLANYVMGSLALQRGDNVQAEAYLRRAADAEKPVTLALNDLAEVLRRNKNLEEAELYARKAVAADANLYVAWETLGSILMDAKRNLDEAEECVRKACDLSRGKDGTEADVRMLISLARVQIARGETARGKGTLRKVQARIGELSDFERAEFEELRKSAR